MSATTPKRYAVVSCHVERVLDDRVWARYRRLVARRPSGFAIASLVRPPDEGAGEDEATWLERAQELAALGPFGHHTHWSGPEHARPTGGDPADRVRREGAWLRGQGLAATLFCGGGWYTDAGVAEACAELGYADCTPTLQRPPYLPVDAARAELARPARVVLPSGRRLPALPTTRSVGMLTRALTRYRGLPEPVVHAYFHDTDLLDGRRRHALTVLLAALGRRRRAIDLEELLRELGPFLPELEWAGVARGAGAPGPPQ